MINHIFKKVVNNKNQDSISYKLRKKRFNFFLKIMHIDRCSKILDVGGDEDIWIDTGLENRVTLLNLKFKRKLPKFTYIQGNACNMSFFSNKKFDIIYSNSVIEHVGSNIMQQKFANEICRVAHKYWVQTPYRHFPIEQHFLFPCFQYFHPKFQRIIGCHWKYSHLKINNENIIKELSKLRLLNINEMKKLFPDTKILKEKYFGLTKSIIAYRC